LSRGDHWEAVYEHKRPDQVSWYQREAILSAELIRSLDLARDAAILDVGGGASTMVDALLALGYEDVTVLDISAAALGAAQNRLGERCLRVRWLHEDLLEWQPQRRYDVWHDRAVFHFLVFPADRALYGRLLNKALKADGHAIVGTFAPGGPAQCSGLEVRQYTPEGICDEFGDRFSLVGTREELHTTPAGTPQPFSWAVIRKGRSRARPG
jgi:SAM-dependent methyltransferase